MSEDARLLGVEGALDQRFPSVRLAVSEPPPPLPPDLPLDTPVEMAGLNQALEQALKSLGYLEGVLSTLPGPSHLMQMYLCKEALLSCQIEGSRARLTDLMLYQVDATPGVPLPDVKLVANYLDAFKLGLGQLQEGAAISWQLLQDMHAVLVQGEKQSSRPGWRMSLPESYRLPPLEQVPERMTDLEAFINADTPQFPSLVKIGLVLLQYEAIHPFEHRHGLMARLLTLLLLLSHKMLAEPVLYVSLHFKAYELQYADGVRQLLNRGEREAWLALFLGGLGDSANQATGAITSLLELFARDQRRLQRLGKRQSKMALQLLSLLQERPIITLAEAVQRLSSNSTTILKAIQTLENLDIVGEATGKRRGKRYAYGEFLEVMGQGAELL